MGHQRHPSIHILVGFWLKVGCILEQGASATAAKGGLGRRIKTDYHTWLGRDGTNDD